MSIEVKVPVLPESVADAVVAAWHKKVGDQVSRDETLVDLETDKVILEVPAVASGVLSELRFEQGDTVTAQQVLAVIEDGAEASAPAPTEDENDDDSTVEEIAVSPSARKLMLENSLTESQVKGTGKAGRILKEDVLRTLEQGEEKAAPASAPAPAAPAAESKPTPTPAPVTDTPYTDGRVEKRVPMTRLRATIANRLLEAQHNAAILTTFNEVNMKPVMDLRKKYKDQFEKQHGIKLGFMGFFVKAVIEALKDFPAVNASIDGNDIVYHGFFDIGVAVSGPNGLVVPVVRDADTMSIAQIEQAIADYAMAAKENSLSLQDINGGTFTISNGGVFGSMMSTPIINPPQSGILGMHAITQRPMAVDGEVVILPMMYLALSYDHRIIDGREAVQFLVSIKNSIEDPSRMLLGV